jgi:hypothetical protein
MTNGPVGTPPTTSNFRDLGDAISPTYLNGPNGARYRYSIAVMYDALSDGFAYAVRARFPSISPPDAIQFIELDRVILQGFAESNSSYRARVTQWLDQWGFAGLPTGILLAMLGYLLPSMPPIRTVDNTSNWNQYAANASPFPPPATMPTPPTYLSGGFNWQWDSAGPPFGFGPLWARLWVIIDSSAGPFAVPTAKWNTTIHWNDGTCWSWAGSSGQASALTTLASQWRAAHVLVVNVIVSYDATMFDPTLPFGSPKLPDGTWGRWGKTVSNGTYGKVYVAARPAASVCSLISGAP